MTTKQKPKPTDAELIERMAIKGRQARHSACDEWLSTNSEIRKSWRRIATAMLKVVREGEK